MDKLTPLLKGFLAGTFCVVQGLILALFLWPSRNFSSLPLLMSYYAICMLLIPVLISLASKTNSPKWLYVGLSLFLPFYGGLCSAGIAFYLCYSRTTQGLAQAYYNLVTNIVIDHTEEQVSAMTIVSYAKNWDTYMTIMKGPYSHLKRLIIKQLTYDWSIEGIQILHLGLKDNNPDIKKMCTHALSHIEQGLNQKIFVLRQKLEQDPDSSSLLTQFLRVSFFYIESELMDDQTKKETLNLTKQILDYLTDLPEKGTQLTIRLKRLEIDFDRITSDYLSEIDHLKALVEQHPTHKGSLSRLCELYLNHHHFESLHTLCGHIVSSVDPNAQLYKNAKNFVIGV